MSESSMREWRFYVDDMIDFARKILTYTDGLNQAAFVANGLIYALATGSWQGAVVRWQASVP